jgi:hypothetical protein
MSYKILQDGVTVLRTVNKLAQADGSTVYQNGMGQIHFTDEVIPDDEVAEDWREALDSGEGSLYEALKDKLEKVSDDPQLDMARRLDLPFEGYEDMEEDDVVAAMKTLPSAAVNSIKQYEATRDEPREQIVNYDVGFGEGPTDRVENKVGGDFQEGDEDKSVRNLTTREISEDGSEMELGEGVTGTGAPQVEPGTKKEADLQATAAKRRGRRDRQPRPSSESGGGSSTSE